MQNSRPARLLAGLLAILTTAAALGSTAELEPKKGPPVVDGGTCAVPEKVRDTLKKWWVDERRPRFSLLVTPAPGRPLPPGRFAGGMNLPCSGVTG